MSRILTTKRLSRGSTILITYEHRNAFNDSSKVPALVSSSIDDGLDSKIMIMRIFGVQRSIANVHDYRYGRYVQMGLKRFRKLAADYFG